MTDDPKNIDRILTSTEEEAVRRQLAAARHTEPMPAEVAGRLDDVLAGLQAERAKDAEAPESNVVPLASRRRHRIAQGIVAAAAVVAVGVGVTQVLGNMSGGSGDDGASEAPAANSDDSAGGESVYSEEGAPRVTSPSVDSELDGMSRAYAAAPAVRSASFQSDVARLATGQRTDTETEEGRTLLRLSTRCGPTTPPAGHDALRVRYDDQPAILAFREPVDGKQRVDLYLCATGVRERSATIDQP
jgi:hypothetical protein